MTNPFALNQIENPLIKRCVFAVSKIDVLKVLYDNWLQQNNDSSSGTDAFIIYVLKQLNVSVHVQNQGLIADIPKCGAFIVVANHPLGGIEGLLLTQLLRAVRPDLKVLTNDLLSTIPEFEDIFIGVDVLNTGKQHYNAQGMRTISRHLKDSGALLVFPAGTVSGIKIPSLKIEDAPWHSMVSRLAQKYDAPIMPVFVEGRNSLIFYLSGCIHKRLRTLLLPRAMLEKNGSVISLYLGQPIPASDLKCLRNHDIAMHYIRVCCEVLSPQNNTCGALPPLHMEDIKSDVDTQKIRDHIQTLSDHLLYVQGDFELYCVEYEHLGPVMDQLSIERERTFRAVNEGAGRELDSDRFDLHYMHLFLWDKAANKIVGGYRLGKTDKILSSFGLDGLYSHSLFKYNEPFLKDMGKTIEVGRSFITQEYQRNPSALDILWKGIGRFVAQSPEYHTLFGCVSISRQYSDLVTAMLIETFLSHYGVSDSIMRNVKARTPLKPIKKPWTTEQIANLSDIPIINKLVGRIDTGKSIPVLIRHYLALNGRFVSFTVNNGFGRSLDGLIMVDLRQSKDRYLKRYMGQAGLHVFRTQHVLGVKWT